MSTTTTAIEFKSAKSERAIRAMLEEMLNLERSFTETEVTADDVAHMAHAIGFGMRRNGSELYAWAMFKLTGWLEYHELGKAFPASTKRSRMQLAEKLGLVETLSVVGGTSGFAKITDLGRQWLTETSKETS